MPSLPSCEVTSKNIHYPALDLACRCPWRGTSPGIDAFPSLELLVGGTSSQPPQWPHNPCLRAGYCCYLCSGCVWTCWVAPTFLPSLPAPRAFLCLLCWLLDRRAARGRLGKRAAVAGTAQCIGRARLRCGCRGCRLSSSCRGLRVQSPGMAYESKYYLKGLFVFLPLLLIITITSDTFCHLDRLWYC